MENDYIYEHSSRPEMLEFIPNDAIYILDVGCGDGAFCEQVKKQNQEREVWGIELNKGAAEKAKTVCDKVLTGDFNKLYSELPQNYFDCIVFNDVLEHLYAPWDAINLCKSLLSKNGVLVSSIPNFRNIHNLIEIVWQGKFQYKDIGILDRTHLRFFTKKSIFCFYEENGYEILINKGIHPVKYWKTYLVEILSFGKLNDVRYTQFATVAKPVKK